VSTTRHPPRQTIRWAPWLYGGTKVALDDPAEGYHEASKLSPVVVDDRVRGARLLEQSPEVRASAARAVKRHGQLPTVALPPGDLPPTAFRDLVAARASERDFGEGSLRLSHVSTLLETAYGVTHHDPGRVQPMRAVPSGGALYPLELYVVALRVARLRTGLYHFDPLRRTLELLRATEAREVAPLTAYPELVVPSAAILVVTAMFWRTRFKYGLRGYRFALLEAGHVGQSLLLAATALGLAALPVGGFFDRRVDAFLGIDGVNESALYAFSVGAPKAGV
jgi:SagB-type dehydrogenase family enzyme